MEMNETRLEAQDLNQQGVLLMKAGNLDAAAAKFDQAIETDPMLMDSYKNYGDLYMTKEQYADAKNSYKKAMLIEKQGLLRFLYGNACFMNDEPHEGLESYNQAVAEGYDNDEMYFFMGMAYEHMNDDNMALRYFQKAYQKNPSRPDYLVKKIGVLFRLNMMDDVEEGVDELLLKAPELFDGYHLKTQLLLQEDKYEEAVSFAKSASERFPEDADLMYDYARATAFSKDFAAAFKIIGTAKKMKYFESSQRDFTMLEAQILAESGDDAAAMERCRDCIGMETEERFDGEARFMYLNLLLVREKYEEALEQANAIVQKNEEDLYYYAALYYKPLCMKYLGKTEEALKNYREANSIYRLATLENPAAVDVYLYRVMCLKDMEEYSKALDLLDFIAGLEMDIAEEHVLRGDIYRLQGLKAQSEEEFQKAYKLKPELAPAQAAESKGE